MRQVIRGDRVFSQEEDQRGRREGCSPIGSLHRAGLSVSRGKSGSGEGKRLTQEAQLGVAPSLFTSFFF